MLATHRHHGLTITLHWVMALALVAQVGLGWYMLGLPDEPPGPQRNAFNLHKSVGICLGVLVLLRLIWLARRPPVPAAPGPRWQQRAAAWTHGLLYLCMLVMPLSGLLGSGFSPYPVRFFGLVLPRWTAPWPEAKQWCSVVHETAGLLLVALVLMHVGAALWHALRLRDGVLQRMLPGAGGDRPPGSQPGRSIPTRHA